MDEMIPKDYHEKVYKLLQDRYIALLERTRWIPVSERLPTDKEAIGSDGYPVDLLVVDRWKVLTAYFQVEERTFKYGDHFPSDTVTHWMPLPEPPDQEV